MVAYNVGNIDAASVPAGSYFIEINAPIRGDNRGNITRRVFQVKHKQVDGETVKYWSLIPADKLREGLPPQLTARALLLRAPNAAEKKALDNGQRVTASAAFDSTGENPTSHFVLKRRKDGAGHVYHWSALTSNRKKGARKNGSSSGAKPKKKSTKSGSSRSSNTSVTINV